MGLTGRFGSWLYGFVQGRALQALEQEAGLRAVRRVLDKFTDEQQLRQVLESGRMRLAVRPTVRSLPEGKRLLVLAPHQDDETIGAGGTLLRAARSGRLIRTVYVTDGAAATKPDNQKVLAAVRRAEADRVWQAMGGETRFWDLPCRRFEVEPATTKLFVDEIRDFRPDTLFVPFFLDPPRDHRYVNRLVLAAAGELPQQDLEVWAYQVSGITAANVVVDISELIEEKTRINALWESQNVHFNYAHYARGMGAFNSVYLPRGYTPVPQERYAELFTVASLNEYVSLLKRYWQDGDENAVQDG